MTNTEFESASEAEGSPMGGTYTYTSIGISGPGILKKQEKYQQIRAEKDNDLKDEITRQGGKKSTALGERVRMMIAMERWSHRLGLELRNRIFETLLQ